MSRFETTYSQWRAFLVASDGWGNERWWLDSRWDGRARMQMIEEDEVDDYPVTWVNWYDATAYCAWLTERLRQAGELPAGYVVRLPSSEEWQFAALGTDGRRFPWGDSYVAGYARTDQIGSVGLSPQDVSPYGVFDMFGNVQEWTQSTSGIAFSARKQMEVSAAIIRGGDLREGSDNVPVVGGRTMAKPNMNREGFRVVMADQQ